MQLTGAKQIRIAYRSAPDAAALQWLAPEQNAGKKQPFLFSQGQAILNRPGFRPRTAPASARNGRPESSFPSPSKQ